MWALWELVRGWLRVEGLRGQSKGRAVCGKGERAARRRGNRAAALVSLCCH